jgi:hypothetical protein
MLQVRAVAALGADERLLWLLQRDMQLRAHRLGFLNQIHQGGLARSFSFICHWSKVYNRCIQKQLKFYAYFSS